MTAKQFRAMTPEYRKGYAAACYERQNVGALMELNAFTKYLDKSVRVVKGRKVSVGSSGVVFWVGAVNYSQFQNWWDWEVRLGFKDSGGEVFFTAEDNVELLPA